MKNAQGGTQRRPQHAHLVIQLFVIVNVHTTRATSRHYVAFCSTPGQEPIVRARGAVEEFFVRETDSLARS